MPDMNLNAPMSSDGGPGGPIFIPIFLTANTSDISSGTSVNFTFTMNSVPADSTYNIGFYSTQNQPGSAADADPVDGSKPPQVALMMTPLSMTAPTITPTANGGTFSVTFTSSSLPTPPDLIIVTVSIANQASLGLYSLSYN